MESLFNKVRLKVCNFIKKGLQHRRFPVKFATFLRKPILKNICERLLVNLAPYSQYFIVAFFNFEKYQETLGQNWIIHNL